MTKLKPKVKATPQPTESPNDSEDIAFKLISLDLIDDPEQPMRTDITPASVEDLVLSIKQMGIIEPIIVKPTDGRYEVIAGHRRTFAARLAKLVEAPCYVRHANKEQTEMLKIHENLYRQDIKPADEAKHFDYLIQKQKMTPTKIAQLTGKSLSYVSDRLAILNYPDFLKEAMDTGKITFSVAREFARFDDIKQMMNATYYAARGGMTQEMAAKWVKDHKRAKESPGFQNEPQADANGHIEQVEHTTNCIYCRKQLRLLDAKVVYMHDDCFEEINNPTPEELPSNPTP